MAKRKKKPAKKVAVKIDVVPAVIQHWQAKGKRLVLRVKKFVLKNL